LERAPLVSIILVNYNGRRFIERCLRSVLNTQYPNFEVILVDNGSTDGSLKLVEKVFCKHPRLRIVRSKINLGFASANNKGVLNAKGKYVVFLNLDTEVESSWLTELVKVAESDYNIGACQSKLLVLSDSALLDSAGDFPTRHGVPYIRSYHSLDSKYKKVEEIFSARAAAMLVRYDALNKVGTFDPSYFIGYEDVDLCWRLRLAGYKVVFVPSSVVYHYGGGLSKHCYSVVVFHKHKNCLVTAIKNFDGVNLLKAFPLLLIFRLMLSILPIKELEGYFGPGPEGFIALFWVIRNFPEVYRKRLFIQKHVRKVSASADLQLMPGLTFEIYLLKWCLYRSKVQNFWSFIHSQFESYLLRKRK
jgi:GT2 family glycosyltransferase